MTSAPSAASVAVAAAPASAIAVFGNHDATKETRYISNLGLVHRDSTVLGSVSPSDQIALAHLSAIGSGKVVDEVDGDGNLVCRELTAHVLT